MPVYVEKLNLVTNQTCVQSQIGTYRHISLQCTQMYICNYMYPHCPRIPHHLNKKEIDMMVWLQNKMINTEVSLDQSFRHHCISFSIKIPNLKLALLFKKRRNLLSPTLFILAFLLLEKRQFTCLLIRFIT